MYDENALSVHNNAPNHENHFQLSKIKETETKWNASGTIVLLWQSITTSFMSFYYSKCIELVSKQRESIGKHIYQP